MDLELRRISVSEPLRSCQILNPYSYILDFDRLMENRMYPTASTVCVRERPPVDSPYLFTAPAGRYLCCRAKILSEDWSVEPLVRYCTTTACADAGAGLRVPCQPVRSPQLPL